MGRFRKSTHARSECTEGRHRFEHWYRDNTVYFITARTRDGFPAFESEDAKLIFWDRFNHWTDQFGFVPWVTTLLFNHYHTLGFLRVGENLGPMMQRIHGSVAKLVNDILPERRVKFWRVENQNDYFDGCIRHDLQCRRAYRYTHLQAVRAGLVKRPEDYAHTRVDIDVEVGIARALELRAFLPHVEYARYAKNRQIGTRR
jgi:hypothetical protein